MAHPFLEFPGLCCPNVGLPTKSDEINIIVIAVVGLLIVIILGGVSVVIIISSVVCIIILVVLIFVDPDLTPI